MERQFAQIGAANRFGMGKYGAEVEAIAGDGRHGLAGHGGCEYASVSAALDPSILYKISKFHKGIHKEDTKKKWI
jgi:hypothetical protein